MVTIIKRITVTLSFLTLAAPAWGLQMFENAERRDPVVEDGRAIVKVQVTQPSGFAPTCTGFFVKNKHGRPYVATARHCASYDMQKACDNNLVKIITESGKWVGRCKAVLAERRDLDTVIITADFSDYARVRESIDFLSLSQQVPRLTTPLKMLGYPGDNVRNGAFTITDHCWISDGRIVERRDYQAAEQSGELEGDGHDSWQSTS